MGVKDAGKNEGDKKANAGKKDDGAPIAVLKVDMNCDRCAKEIRECVKKIDGVQDVKTDIATNEVTVVGKVDPTKLRAKLAKKTGKKVELISQPKKDAAGGGGGGGGGGDKKSDDKAKKKPETKKPKEVRRCRARPVEPLQMHNVSQIGESNEKQLEVIMQELIWLKRMIIVLVLAIVLVIFKS